MESRRLRSALRQPRRGERMLARIRDLAAAGHRHPLASGVGKDDLWHEIMSHCGLN